MSESKFENRPLTPDEEKEFMADLQTLVKKHSIYLEAVPEFTRTNNLEDGKLVPFTVTAKLFLQKVKEIVEAEKVAEPESTPSPYNETDKKN